MISSSAIIPSVILPTRDPLPKGDPAVDKIGAKALGAGPVIYNSVPRKVLEK